MNPFTRSIAIFLLAIVIAWSAEAQPKLWGTLPLAGKPGAGLIYELNLSNTQFSAVHALTKYEGEKSRHQVLLAGNNKFYGIADGGYDQFGSIIYEFDPATSEYFIVQDFYDPVVQHSYGAGECYLMQASDGLIYGFNQNGGLSQDGQLFSYNPSTADFQYLADFEALTTGGNPVGVLCEAPNGMLYGVASDGGICDYGTLFSFDIGNGILAQDHCFDWTEGANPEDGLVMASNGLLYGMTNGGGVNGDGVIYSYEPGTGIFTLLHEFNTAAHGGKPYGRLFQASDGKLYGMASSGGANGKGILFRYDIDLDLFVLRINFDGINGQYPNGSLIEHQGYLYGMTTEGGVANEGILFRFDPVANIIIKLTDFYGADYGRYPYGSLSIGPNGNLFGQTYSGGKFDKGIMFEYNAATSVFTKRFDFDQADEGAMNISGLMHGTDGWVYGTTYMGGQYHGGTIYRINPDNREFESLYEFDISTYGGNPYSGLMQADDGFFYGVNPFGGTVGAGTIYRFDANSKIVTVLEDLITPSEGKKPSGPPVQASDGFLYGLTNQGGAMGHGAIYRFNLSNSTYSKLADFQDAASGSRPVGSFIEAANGKLYALAEQGGQFGYGTLFEYDPTGGTFFVVVHFDGLNKGATPTGTLLEYDDNIIYGMCSEGGLNDVGTIFVYDAITNICTKVHDFNTAGDGAYPLSSLMKASNEKIYGTTHFGGAYNSGVLFEMDPVSDDYILIHEFENYREYPWFGALLEVDTDYGTDEDEMEEMTFELFPNPAFKHINIKPVSAGTTTIRILNQSGQIVMNYETWITANGFDIQIEDLNEGVYVLQLTNEQGSTATRKFVKIK